MAQALGIQRGPDNKSLGKPGSFAGEPGERDDWSFVVKSYVGAMGQEDREILERVEVLSTEAELGSMGSNMKR
eukprot:5776106-Alexandrium_andersonii.AAC.1